jgi:hypothetical protein
MGPEVRMVMGKKRLVLFEKLLSEIEYKDVGLIKELAEGIKIVGRLNSSMEFPQREDGQRRPTGSGDVDVLGVTAKWAQHAVRGRKGTDNSMAKELWDLTLKEAVEKGWLSGPYESSEISEMLGSDWVPMRRFGVVQGGKLRPIDDGSEFLQNSTVVAPERVDLGGFEEYLALAREWVKCVGVDRIALTLPNGDVLRGTLHREWSVTAARDLVGRTADLSHAYKQIAVLPERKNPQWWQWPRGTHRKRLTLFPVHCCLGRQPPYTPSTA